MSDRTSIQSMMHKRKLFFSVGRVWRGGGGIREIFLYKESGKCFFFYKKSKSNKKKKKNSGGWEGRGCGLGK